MNIPPSPNIPPYNASVVSQSDKTMAMLAYILGIFTSFVGPLVLWLLKKGRSKFVAFHALQALLLHMILLVGYALSIFLIYFLIGLVIYPMFFVLGLVLSIVVGMAAGKGEWFEVPVIGKIARWLAGL